jgi:hypothetical protein
LSAEPGAAARRDGGFDDCDAKVGTLLAEDVGSAETTRSGTNDDNVRFGIFVEVLITSQLSFTVYHQLSKPTLK